jgi:polyphosphate kinase
MEYGTRAGAVTSRYFGEMDDLFAYLEGQSGLPKLDHILLAPDQLRSRLEELIDYEINEALNNRKALITLKLNNSNSCCSYV